MIYEVSCGCELEYPGKANIQSGETIYCPTHGFVTITEIRRPPKPARVDTAKTLSRPANEKTE